MGIETALAVGGLLVSAYSAFNQPKQQQQQQQNLTPPPIPTTEPKTGITKTKNPMQAAMLSAGMGTPTTTAGALAAPSKNLLGG